MNDLIAMLVALVVVFFLVGVISVFLALPVMWCWNYVMPDLFGWVRITWGQAWCLMALCGFLFDGFNVNNSKK